MCEQSFWLRRKQRLINKLVENNSPVMIPQVNKVQSITYMSINSCGKLCVIMEQWQLWCCKRTSPVEEFGGSMFVGIKLIPTEIPDHTEQVFFPKPCLLYGLTSSMWCLYQIFLQCNWNALLRCSNSFHHTSYWKNKLLSSTKLLSVSVFTLITLSNKSIQFSLFI